MIYWVGVRVQSGGARIQRLELADRYVSWLEQVRQRTHLAHERCGRGCGLAWCCTTATCWSQRVCDCFRVTPLRRASAGARVLPCHVPYPFRTRLSDRLPDCRIV
ncbi:hypothetical protein M3J09_005387 [Ascochyta lentis]